MGARESDLPIRLQEKVTVLTNIFLLPSLPPFSCGVDLCFLCLLWHPRASRTRGQEAEYGTGRKCARMVQISVCTEARSTSVWSVSCSEAGVAHKWSTNGSICLGVASRQTEGKVLCLVQWRSCRGEHGTSSRGCRHFPLTITAILGSDGNTTCLFCSSPDGAQADS